MKIQWQVNSASALPEPPKVVERLADPKKALELAFQGLLPGTRGRRRASPNEFLDLLGDSASLERLRQVPAFQTLEAEVIVALQHLNYLGTQDA